MVVLQDSTGIIYTAQPNVAPKKLFNSLVEYIENVGRFSPNENARLSFYYEKCDEFGQDLIERMENGLVPLLPSGTSIYLHHMGLSRNTPITISPLVEFKDEEYYEQHTLQTLFNGFVCDNDYDRIICIKQKQKYWNKRSKLY